MLAVYDVAHSLPLGAAVWDFPFAEDETRRQFLYFSGTFRESLAITLEYLGGVDCDNVLATWLCDNIFAF